MQISSTNIVSNVLQNPFGSLGQQFLNKIKPTRSFQLSWQDLPKNTVSLALTLLDHDAIPVCGFTWIHWTAANIDPSLNSLPENASLSMKLLQGVTSWSSRLLPPEVQLTLAEDQGYGGCAPPPGQTHCFTLTVYALDTLLTLQPGFYANELLTTMEGHIVDQAILKFWYPTE